MESRGEFQKQIKAALNLIGAETLAYNEDEFWMIRSAYEYIEYYAIENRLWNTSIALPLARGLHNGVYRKNGIEKNGVKYRLPYMIHPLLVCRMLVDMQIPISRAEEDIMLAAALCHDMIEDIDFPEKGMELVTQYQLDPLVYETVKKVSKRKDFTAKEEREFFHAIESDKLAMLIKLSDRGQNVEDLYNMKTWKVHEYADETRRFILPMCNYARRHYPELRQSVEVIEDKLIGLTRTAETLVDRYGARELELQRELNQLETENRLLREEWQKLWQDED